MSVESTADQASTAVAPDALDAIRRHAAHAYPHECCGALLATDAGISDVLALTNTTDGPAARRFLVGPNDYRRAEAWAAAAGGRLAGFYHSHPDHPARPSQHDLDHAWPSFLYIIVSVMKGEPAEMTGWRLRDDRSAFEQGELTTWPTES